MQYLIDIIIEQLIQKTGFYHRPPIAGIDFNKAALAPDTDWHTHSLAGIVPAGTKAVLMHVSGLMEIGHPWLYIRTPGDTHWYHDARFQIQEQSITNSSDKIVALNDDLQFQTLTSSTEWTNLFIHISGWWQAGIIQNAFHNRGDPTIYDFGPYGWTADGAWHTLDLSSILPLGTNAVLCSVSADYSQSNRRLHFRTKANQNTINISTVTVYDPAIIPTEDITIPTRGLAQIEYSFDAPNFVGCLLTVKGWWF